MHLMASAMVLSVLKRIYLVHLILYTERKQALHGPQSHLPVFIIHFSEVFNSANHQSPGASVPPFLI